MTKHTPFPWQRSYYAPHALRRVTDPATVERHRAEEALIMRGPGKIGTPGCNPVAYFNRPEDRDECVARLERLQTLETEVSHLLDLLEVSDDDDPELAHAIQVVNAALSNKEGTST